MEEIINYTMTEFFQQDMETVQQYITMLALIPAVPTKQEVFYMRLRHVQDIKELMQEGTLDSLVEIIALTEFSNPEKKWKSDAKEQKKRDLYREQVMQMKIVDFFGLINSAKEQIETIYKAEVSSLASTQPNFKWEAVNGGEKIAKFGIYNTLDSLSSGDITKEREILEIPYADIFMKLYMRTVKGDLEYEMSQIKTK